MAHVLVYQVECSLAFETSRENEEVGKNKQKIVWCKLLPRSYCPVFSWERRRNRVATTKRDSWLGTEYVRALQFEKKFPSCLQVVGNARAEANPDCWRARRTTERDTRTWSGFIENDVGNVWQVWVQRRNVNTACSLQILWIEKFWTFWKL